MSENNGEKKEKITVNVDTKRTEELARENERLKMTLEKAEEKPDLEVKSTLEDKKLDLYNQLHDDRILTAKDEDELKATAKVLIAEGLEAKRQKPTGSAPIQSDYFENQKKTDDIFTRKFETVQDMVKELHRREKSENSRVSSQATAILNELFKRWTASVKAGQNPSFYDPNTEDNLPITKKTTEGFRVPVIPSEGDLGKFKKTHKEKEKEAKEFEEV